MLRNHAGILQNIFISKCLEEQKTVTATYISHPIDRNLIRRTKIMLCFFSRICLSRLGGFLTLILFAEIIRLELQPEPTPQVRVREGELLYVLQVWSQVIMTL